MATSRRSVLRSSSPRAGRQTLPKRKVTRPRKVAAIPEEPSSRSVTSFFDPAGLVSFDVAAARFGMSKLQFAETLGLKKETVYRASRVNAPKVQARAKEMIEIVRRIAGWAGGEPQAIAWYRAEPIPAFGGRTAESLVKSGKATAVRDYLDAIATGGFA
ncbi:MAG: DUF2384 domain-containing protein [Bauldia sp.]|nr:DUF2384 domain-containing protein [Bauldia sp.]